MGRRNLRARFWEGMKSHGEGFVYRVAGLLAPRAGAGCGAATARIRCAYRRYFWRPEERGEWLDIALALTVGPFALLAAAAWMTCRNGGLVRRRCGKPALTQFVEQMQLALAWGLLPPWYYIFECYLPAARRAVPDILSRAETKAGAYRVLAASRQPNSPLGDKLLFFHYSRAAALPVIPVVAVARDGQVSFEQGSTVEELAAQDLFIKPVRASGGSGASRLTYLGDSRWRLPSGQTRARAELVRYLARLSCTRPVLLQPRLVNHPTLRDLNNDALATVRVLTCLDETETPEVIGAVFRMAIGANRTVDNLHAGGIAAAVDLESGRLGRATNLGSDAALGWISIHPQSGAMIEGRALPEWRAVLELARQAHRAFADHLLVGWDIAVTPDSLALVEGNSGPDLDIMQRVSRKPMGVGRFGELLALHLDRSLPMAGPEKLQCGRINPIWGT